MRKIFFVFIAMMSLSFTASAQFDRSSTKQQCTRRCIAADAEHPQKSKFFQRIEKIREMQKTESEPLKIKELEKAEQEEIEHHKDELESLCRKACSSNPDE